MMRRSVPDWLRQPVVVSVAVLVVALIALAALGLRPARRSSAVVETIPVASNNHVTAPVNYPQTPPVGGDHAPVWQNCGFYDSPVVTEAAVHSLEHGAVWITYRPDLARGQVDALRRLAQGQRYVLVSPFSGLPAPIVASAWGRQLKVQDASDPALAAFVRDFQSGRQAPEPGAPCSGGSGTPIVSS